MKTSVHWRSARRFHSRLLRELNAGDCDMEEHYRRLAIAQIRQRARKIAVIKAAIGFGLIFLICGGAALVGYALSM